MTRKFGITFECFLPHYEDSVEMYVTTERCFAIIDILRRKECKSKAYQEMVNGYVSMIMDIWYDTFVRICGEKNGLSKMR